MKVHFANTFSQLTLSEPLPSHKRLEKEFGIVSVSCVWHTADAWSRKQQKFSYTPEQEEKIAELKRILKQSLYENKAFVTVAQNFISNLPPEILNHEFVQYILKNYTGNGHDREPLFNTKYWSCQDIFNDPKYSNIPYLCNLNRTNNTVEPSTCKLVFEKCK